MRKWGFRVSVLCLAMTVGLCVSAFAVDAEIEVEESGVYGFSSNAITSDAEGYPVEVTKTGDDVTIKGASQSDVMYYETEYVTYETEELTAGVQYLVILQTEVGVPTKDNIAYIDQVEGTGTTHKFKLYPNDWDTGTYHVYLSSSDQAQNEVAYFSGYAAVDLGDVNGDGKINSQDALAALKIAATPSNYTAKQAKAANVNGDTKVNSQDALLILKHAAKPSDNPFRKAGSAQ